MARMLGFKSEPRIDRPSPARSRGRAFSLLELIVVLAITSILTALLFPGMRAARDSAHRLMCASNMRQLGSAMILYAHDHRERIPHSELARRGLMFDRMALTVSRGMFSPRDDFDGLGLLIRFGMYCDSTKCLYCPSHRGDHQYEVYESGLQRADGHTFSPDGALFSNYHYVGNDGSDKLHLLSDDRILITDSFRTKADYNHRDGMNTVRGDCSIQWWNDNENEFYMALPDAPLSATGLQSTIFDQVWSLVGDEEEDAEDASGN